MSARTKKINHLNLSVSSTNQDRIEYGALRRPDQEFPTLLRIFLSRDTGSEAAILMLLLGEPDGGCLLGYGQNLFD